MKKWLLLGGAALLVGAAVGLPILIVKRGNPQAQLQRRFDAILEDLGSSDFIVVEKAVRSLAAQHDLLGQTALIEPLAKKFAERPLADAGAEGLLNLGYSFWKTIFDSDNWEVRKILSQSLSALRHRSLINLQKGNLELLRDQSLCSPEQQSWIADKLLREFFGASARGKSQIGLLLWDRAQLEELAGKVPEALDSLRQIKFNKVREHWEMAADRERYVVLRADLMARIGRKVPPQASDASALEALNPDDDEEIQQFLKTDPDRKIPLLQGIFSLHQGDAEKAVEELTQFLAKSGVPEQYQELPSVPGYLAQLGLYWRAVAHHEAALQAYRQGRPAYLFKIQSEPARLRLKLRLLRHYFELDFQEDFILVLRDYFGGSQREKPLFLALGRLLEARRLPPSASANPSGERGDKDKSDREAHSILNQSILKFLKDHPGSLHADDRRWFESLAAGQAPGPPPILPTLFRVGRIYEELGEAAKLEKTIRQMEFFIEDEPQQFYVELLRSILLKNRGLMLEAWQVLQKLLNREKIPKEIDRGFLNTLVQELDRMTKGQAKVRQHIRAAEEEFRKLYQRRADFNPEVAVAAGVGLFGVRAGGQLMDPDPAWTTFQNNDKLLMEILGQLESQDRPSYFLERVWLDLKNHLVRSFQDHLQRGNYEETLDCLRWIGRIQRQPKGPQILRQKAMVYRDRARAIQEDAGRENARLDWQQAAELFTESFNRSSQDISLLKEAVAAFEESGDPVGILKAIELDIGKIPSTERDLFLAIGKALVQVGEYQKGIQTLNRLIQIYWGVDLPTEELDRPFALGAHYPILLPDDLTAWLELDPVVDPANRTGTGQLFFDSKNHTLRWLSPGDRNPGPEVMVVEGDRIRLVSGDDPRKALILTVKLSRDGGQIPPDSRIWEIRIAQRDFPAETAEAYLWRSIAQVQRVRSSAPFGETLTAADFIRKHMLPEGDAVVQAGIREILEKLFLDSYQIPELGESLKKRLQDAVDAWEEELEGQSQKGAKNVQGEFMLQKRQLTSELKGRLDSADGAVALLRHQDSHLQARLGGINEDLVLKWLEKNGPTALEILQNLERRRLDAEARNNLIFLCEHFGNRHPVWQSAMFIRGYQLCRQAEEVEAARPPAAAASPEPSRRKEAREILERLVLASEGAPASQWVPMALFLLGNLASRARQWEEARGWFEQLAELEKSSLLRNLFPEDQQEVRHLIHAAWLAKADASFQLSQFSRSLEEYQKAATLLADSPLILWIQYQLGNCFQNLGRAQEALREFSLGKKLLAREFQSPDRRANWLTGDRRQSIASALNLLAQEDARLVREKFLVKDESESSAPKTGPEKGPEKGPEHENSFWDQLYDVKIQLLGAARQVAERG
ncbi:MAG: hypothetical protein HY717_09800 [Planctomycetes bacterium]|nr:hypothetical protein [Planctomycetota bacterium]